MIAAPALVLVVMLAAGDPLAEAQQAFSEGRYAEAEQLALQAAHPPQEGAAFYLVGLSRFRAGKPAEAMEALDAAGQAADAPERGPWNFNRGACLYALGRFAEAEQAFLAATADDSLARVALANAGFAALDAGSPERAAQWAARARPGASERELALVEDLLAEISGVREPRETEGSESEAYRQGLAAFDAGRFEEARAHFLEAQKQAPSSGRARLMAGASAYRAGDRATARADISSALDLQLAPLEEETAREYLDRLSFGLRSNGRGVGLSAGASLGFDSNVLQVGVAPRDVSGGMTELVTGSPFAEVGLGIVARMRLSDAVFSEFSYGGSQRAYSVSSARDYSLQLHRVGASLEWEMAHHLRLGGSVSGDVFFTGLSAFRGLQASGGASAWLAVDESELTSTRLDASFARKLGLGDEFSYLTGRRLDATVSQELRLRTVAVTAWYRYRADLIGTLEQAASVQGSDLFQEYVIPFAWAGHATGASARWVLNSWLDASLDAGVEWRRYRSDSFLRVQFMDGTQAEWNRRQRRDVRFVLGPQVSARLARHVLLSMRYDLLVNSSNVDTQLEDTGSTCLAPEFVCHRYDYTNGNYQKHLPTLELSASW
ncbi:tetratricopeptide repeat protein [Hyalangium versicolor]|uniref:tetratricopeptide repeat protein n=1 Tax=Hyalangium versicolor TaxID=2861190 RepID=UPI001CCD7F8D|nr:tetratricopeptide repeat protein [Hyalangium versicolor]